MGSVGDFLNRSTSDEDSGSDYSVEIKGSSVDEFSADFDPQGDNGSEVSSFSTSRIVTEQSSHFFQSSGDFDDFDGLSSSSSHGKDNCEMDLVLCLLLCLNLQHVKNHDITTTGSVPEQLNRKHKMLDHFLTLIGGDRDQLMELFSRQFKIYEPLIHLIIEPDQDGAFDASDSDLNDYIKYAFDKSFNRRR